MAAASPTDSRLADFVATIPAPGDTAQSHLEHTLACFEHLSDGAALLHGPDAALTVGHLRALAADRTDRAAMFALLSVLVAHRGKPGNEHAIVATRGVYGAHTTGLTWADLLELAL